MQLFTTTTILLATALPLASAHFLLNYPGTAGFDDDLEGTAPCGSFTPWTSSSPNVTDFHVGGDSISLTSTHPAAVWAFRAALGTDPSSATWTYLTPAISQSGLGAYCQTDLSVPGNWTGQKGIVQVVQDAADGQLFQCAAVNFVAGSMAPPSVCRNATGDSAVATQDAALSGIPTSAAASTGASQTAAATSKSAAAPDRAFGGLWIDGAAGTVLLAGLIAAGTLVVRL